MLLRILQNALWSLQYAADVSANSRNAVIWLQVAHLSGLCRRYYRVQQYRLRTHRSCEGSPHHFERSMLLIEAEEVQVLFKVRGLLRPRCSTWATGSRHEECDTKKGLPPCFDSTPEETVGRMADEKKTGREGGGGQS